MLYINKVFLLFHRQEGIKDIDALFGKAKYMEMRRNFSGAMDLISQAVVAYPNFLPALIEKMKVQLALQDWEQTVETAHRWDNLENMRRLKSMREGLMKNNTKSYMAFSDLDVNITEFAVK